MAAAARLHRPASDLTLRMRPTRLHTDVVKVSLLMPAVSVAKPARRWYSVCWTQVRRSPDPAAACARPWRPFCVAACARQPPPAVCACPAMGRAPGLALMGGSLRASPPLSGSQRPLPPI